MLHEIDLSRTDLNLLVLFEAVFQERHVGRAADRLSLSPSAVSHGLGRLRRLLNDPLFVRTPKGVVATERAVALSAPVAEALARMRAILASAEPFDPARSARRFTIGAPDGVTAVLLPAVLRAIRATAPGVDISLRQLLPSPGERTVERAWRGAFADLEARAADIAIVPSDEIPARFHRSVLYEEAFVVAMRAGHAFAAEPSLDAYCASEHLMVSLTGDPHGFVDDALATLGRRRRVAVTVPDFMFTLAVLADTDLIAALPRRFVESHAARFGLVWSAVPVPVNRFRLSAVAPAAAMTDAGLTWLFGVLERAARGPDRIEAGTG